MNQNLFTYSESLVLSLSNEIEYIKNRSKNINYSLKTCQNKTLSTRLKTELNNLDNSRIKIINISENLIKKNCSGLSFEFLLEVTKRSKYIQQT